MRERVAPGRALVILANFLNPLYFFIGKYVYFLRIFDNYFDLINFMLSESCMKNIK